jgi:type IV pilus assembly protein PilA
MACSLRYAVCDILRTTRFCECGLWGARLKGRSAQAGFTFIELMAVIAIMGILVTIMMPAVKNYVARAKVTEAISALTNCRTPVSEVFQTGGSTFPSEWGCEVAMGKGSKYVDTVTVEAGVIMVLTAGAMGDLRIAPKTITLAPLARSGLRMTEEDLGDPVFRWRCGAVADGTEESFDVSLLPSTCRGY